MSPGRDSTVYAAFEMAKRLAAAGIQRIPRAQNLRRSGWALSADWAWRRQYLRPVSPSYLSVLSASEWKDWGSLIPTGIDFQTSNTSAILCALTTRWKPTGRLSRLMQFLRGPRSGIPRGPP